MGKTYSLFAKLLEEHDTTAYAVAKATGIPSSTFSEWKNGKYQPKVENIKKIADFFDVPFTDFYDDLLQ